MFCFTKVLVCVCVYVYVGVNGLGGVEKSLNGLRIHNIAWRVGVEMYAESQVQVRELMKARKTVRCIN